MNFGEALVALRMGKFLTRQKWPNITYVFLKGEIIMYSHMGVDYVWTPAHLDLLAQDWTEVTPTR